MKHDSPPPPTKKGAMTPLPPLTGGLDPPLGKTLRNEEND